MAFKQNTIQLHVKFLFERKFELKSSSLSSYLFIYLPRDVISQEKTATSSRSIKHRAGQRCFELLALIGSPQLSFQRYSQLNKHLGLTGKP